MSNQSNASNQEPRTVQDIIRAIEAKSSLGGYIYRGEPECHEMVSSNLFRELKVMGGSSSDIEMMQTAIVATAKQYSDKTDDFDVLADLQHYGSKTNLIDFTTNYNVALFFACYGAPDKCGRVILLEKTAETQKLIRYPRSPRTRVSAQRSVFVNPPRGYIERSYETICVPGRLKLAILDYLRTEHNIDPVNIYRDIHGFIRGLNVHYMAHRELYSGLSWREKGDKATNSDEKRSAYGKAIESFTKALESELPRYHVYNNRGLTFGKIGNHDRAIDDFNAAIRIEPNLPAAYNYRGAIYLKECDYDRAVTDYTKVIELNPNFARAYMNRGGAYHKKCDYDLAINDFTKVIARKPHDAQAYANRGASYGEKGDYDLAIQDFTRAIELKPNYAGAHNNRGAAYAKKRDYDRAIDDLITAIDLNPTNVDAYVNLGAAYREKGDNDRAIDSYNKAIEINPKDAEALKSRAAVYLKKSDCCRAIEDYTEVIRLNSVCIESYNNRGVAFGAKGNYDQAIADFKRAIEIKPDYVDAHRNRDHAFRLKGENQPSEK